MAFTVQEDVAVPGANSYGSVADFRAYHTDRGNTVPTDESSIEQALVRATDYLDTRFRFVGCRDTADQTTEWPRDQAYDDRGDAVNGLPSAVVHATFEYALRAASADLLPDPERDGSGRAVASKSEAVGPLKESVSYAYGGTVLDLPQYPRADRLLYARKLVRRSPVGIGVGTLGRS